MLSPTSAAYDSDRDSPGTADGTGEPRGSVPRRARGHVAQGPGSPGVDLLDNTSVATHVPMSTGNGASFLPWCRATCQASVVQALGKPTVRQPRSEQQDQRWHPVIMQARTVNIQQCVATRSLLNAVILKYAAQGNTQHNGRTAKIQDTFTLILPLKDSELLYATSLQPPAAAIQSTWPRQEPKYLSSRWRQTPQ